MNKLALKRLSDNYHLTLRFLNLLIPGAMREHREYKRHKLKSCHRYWEIETPYDSELKPEPTSL